MHWIDKLMDFVETIKGRITLGVFVATLAFALCVLTWKFLKFSMKHSSTDLSQNFLLKRLNCCTSGLFLALCFLDFLPSSSAKIYTALAHSGITTSFPISELSLTVTFIIILTVDQLIQEIRNNKHPGYSRLLNPRNQPQVILCGSTTYPYDNDRLSEMDQVPYCGDSFYDGDSYDDNIDPGSRTDDLSFTNLDRQISNISVQKITSTTIQHTCMLVFVLSVYSFLQGMAIGFKLVESDYKLMAKNKFQYVIVLCIQQSLLALCVGVHLSYIRVSSCFLYLLTFATSIICSLGLTVSFIISSISPMSITVLLLEGILQSFLCSTLLYVLIFESFQYIFFESCDNENKVGHVLTLSISFAIVTIMLYFKPNPANLQCLIH